MQASPGSHSLFVNLKTPISFHALYSAQRIRTPKPRRSHVGGCSLPFLFHAQAGKRLFEQCGIDHDAAALGSHILKFIEGAK
jgi:hypothetical protein